MKYLLDTSAVIAHFRREAGHTRVQAIFEEDAAAVLIAAPSLLEADTVLKAKIADVRQRRAVLDLYAGRLADVVPANREAALAAIEIKNASATRLPSVDALIAGCAVAHGAILVHRDPHFDGLPADLLKTMRLSDADDQATSADVPRVVREKRTAYKAGKRKRKPRT